MAFKGCFQTGHIKRLTPKRKAIGIAGLGVRRGRIILLSLELYQVGKEASIYCATRNWAQDKSTIMPNALSPADNAIENACLVLRQPLGKSYAIAQKQYDEFIFIFSPLYSTFSP